MKLNRLFIAISLSLSPVILEAQEISIGNDDNLPIEERIIYSHESMLHATLHTQGLGFGYQRGKIRSIYKTTHWDFELAYYRSQKQVKLVNLFGTTSFVYGKLNDMVAIRAGYEVERRIYGKPYWGGVELRWLYEAGASLALLKPYYYTVVVTSADGTGQVYDYQTFDKYNQWIDIVGKAPIKYGLSEIKVRPGVYAKGGMCFEIGSKSALAQSIEVGAIAECFPQGINLMANTTDYVFLNLYLSYHWGSRFNK